MRYFVTLLVAGALVWGGYHYFMGAQDIDGRGRHAPGARSEPPNVIAELGKKMQEIAPQMQASNAPASASAARFMIHYAPEENLELMEASVIAQSRCDHLDIAMYAETDWKIALSVEAFANTGRKVRIYRDQEQYEQEQSRGAYIAALFHGNPNIQIRVKNSTTLMHIKSWTDGCLLRDGSANWSPSGEVMQNNTLIFTNSLELITTFEGQFNAMWNRPDNMIVQ